MKLQIKRKMQVIANRLQNMGVKSALFMSCALAVLIVMGCGGKTVEPTDVKATVATDFWPIKYSPTLEDFTGDEGPLIAPYPHIVSVRLVLDSYAPFYENRIRSSLENVAGVGSVKISPELKIVELMPEEGTHYIDLSDVRDSVDAIRGIKVIRMDVFAVGELASFMVKHRDLGPDPYQHKRYKAIVGDQPDQVFVLVENNKLEQVVSYDKAILIGRVSAFEGKAPILEITDFAPVEG